MGAFPSPVLVSLPFQSGAWHKRTVIRNIRNNTIKTDQNAFSGHPRFGAMRRPCANYSRGQTKSTSLLSRQVVHLGPGFFQILTQIVEMNRKTHLRTFSHDVLGLPIFWARGGGTRIPNQGLEGVRPKAEKNIVTSPILMVEVVFLEFCEVHSMCGLG